jgi:hypothetical protein
MNFAYSSLKNSKNQSEFCRMKIARHPLVDIDSANKNTLTPPK